MNANNSLQPAQKTDFNNALVEYEVNGKPVKLSPNIIRNYLVNGGGNVTNQEVTMFLQLCKFQGLNPFLREAYLIKYGNAPATIVTGKEVFTKRARRNTDYAGQQAGVVVLNNDNKPEQRIGALVLPGEMLVGGWAKVFIKGYEQPVEITVSFEEYAGRKKDGEINGQWASKPGTMIRKVALVQALREAFPEDFQGLYSPEEMSSAVNYDLPDAPVELNENPAESAIEPPQENSNPFEE